MRSAQLAFRLVLLVLGAGIGATAAAEDRPAPEVSGGYQLERVWRQDDNLHSRIRLGRGDAIMPWRGWYFDAAANVAPKIALVGQFGGIYGNESRTQGAVNGDVTIQIHQFLGGLRVNGATGKTRPFAQFLGGAVRSKFRTEGTLRSASPQTVPDQSFYDSESSTDIAVSAGGGVDIAATRSVGVRFGGDYLRLLTDRQGTHVVRVTAGIVLFLLQ
jgi:opacity protein-like surface antigen